MMLTGKSLNKINKSIIYKGLMVIITFHFVCFGWIFFKSQDLETAVIMLNQIFYNFDINVFLPFYDNYKEVIWMIAFAMAIHFIPEGFIDKLIEKRKRIPLILYIFIFFMFLLLYGFFKTTEQVMPIYLQF
jgi:hypothetical protein